MGGVIHWSSRPNPDRRRSLGGWPPCPSCKRVGPGEEFGGAKIELFQTGSGLPNTRMKLSPPRRPEGPEVFLRVSERRRSRRVSLALQSNARATAWRSLFAGR